MISINTDLYNQLMDIKHETGLTVTAVVNKFIAYGVKNVEIKDNKNDD
ncbi:hypothetical protein [Lentilactobacillus parabuchneri]|nr:hypothetical protein [Lentilactobacillus parabuchneri]